jgi:hypothetical protein
MPRLEYYAKKTFWDTASFSALQDAEKHQFRE